MGDLREPADAREERRRAARHRALKGGRIVFHHGSSVIDCVIRNMSDTGAALDVASTIGIPDEFELHLADHHLPRTCHVQWRKGDRRIGVVFAETAAH